MADNEEYLKQKKALANLMMAGELSEEEGAKYAEALRSKYDPTVGEQVKSGAKAVGGGLLTALDYLGGLSRTNIANQLEEISKAAGEVTKKDATLGQRAKGLLKTAAYVNPLAGPALLASEYFGTPEAGDVVGKEELVKAVKGEAPSSSEYLEKAGVPELGSVQVPLLGEAIGGVNSMLTGNELTPEQIQELGKVTGRGVLGFGGDILTDPLTYLTGGLSKAGKAGEAVQKTVQAPKTLIQQAGKKLYGSGLKSADVALDLANKDKAAFKELGLLNKLKGSPEQLWKKARSLDINLSRERKNLLRNSTKTVDTQKTLQPLLQKIEGEIAEASGTRATELYKAKDMLESIAQKGADIPDSKLLKEVPTGLLDATGNPMTKTVEQTVKGSKPLTALQANKERKFLSDATKWGADIKNTEAQKFIQEGERLLDDAISQSVEAGKQGGWKEIGRKQSLLKDAIPSLKSEARKSMKRTTLTQPKAALITMGPKGMLAAGAMETARAVQAPKFLTEFGSHLASEVPANIYDAMIRRYGVGQGQELLQMNKENK